MPGSQLRIRLRALLRRRRAEADLDDEIRFHLDRAVDKYVRAGMSPAAARRRASLDFGGVAGMRDDVREAWGVEAVRSCVADLRHGCRLLARTPTFTVAALLTMALGIGATTAIYSLVDATLLRPLPYPDPDQLVTIVDDLPGVGAEDVGLSQPEWQDLAHAGIFSAVSPAWYDEQNLTGATRPTRVNLLIVAPGYFEVMGVPAARGRTFDPADRRPGILPDVVISDGLWTRVFGRDPAILGRSIRLDTDLYQIVGVMPPGFRSAGLTTDERAIDVWAGTNFFGMPLKDRPPRNERNLPETIARLRPGLTPAAATERLNALVAALRQQYPADYPAQSNWAVRLVPVRDRVFGNVRQSLLLLLGAVGLVLLIGSVNVANLLLARASTRAREMAIRQALGAGRGRLARQLLAESLLLSIGGGLAGMAVVAALEPWLVSLIPESLPQLGATSIRWTAWLVAMGASVVTGVAFGLAPARQAGRLDLTRALKQEGRSTTGSRDQARTRRALVVVECALSLTLMVATALLLRSFWAIAHAPMGFTPDDIVTVRTRLPYPNNPGDDIYRTLPQKATFVREVLRRAQVLPGVEEAAIGNATSVPLDHKLRDASLDPVFIEGRPRAGSDSSYVDTAVVTPGYFHVLRIPVVRGRVFTDFDDERTAPVAVVNEAMAAAYWPDQDPIGARVKLSASATTWMTVVGIVADTRVDAIDEPRMPQIYASLYQRGDKRLAVFLRGTLDVAAVAEGVRADVQSVDPRLPVFSPHRLSSTVAASLAARRFAMNMVGVFGLTAALLAGIGIYGVVAYMVGERTHEFGIRLALGASRRRILNGVLTQALTLTAAGMALGLGGAFVAARLLAGVLYGVSPADPLVFLGVTAALVVVALGASYVPARRAVRIDPTTTLR